MRTPNQSRAGRRRWVTGAAVTGGVLLLTLLVLALWPRTATATASFTVTPRTESGAGAAVLLADRYAALAGSAETLRAAREGDPALAGIGQDELVEGTDVDRTGGAATIGVAVTLDDADAAVAAANAVVGTLVEAGADEDLVDVAPGREATAARADRRPDVARWALVALLVAPAAGLLAAATTARPARQRPTRPTDDPAPAEPVDDLPGFLERPPGSPPPLPPAGPGPLPTTGATAVGAATPVAVRGTVPATVAGAAALVVAAVLVVATGGAGSPEGGRAAAASVPEPIALDPGPTAPTAPAAPGPGTAVPTGAAAPATAAGALALESVPTGEDGVTASVTFTGVVLEQRAVGLTVSYPSLSISTDGRRALAHLRLPTFNCLTADPPPDPLAAGCVRSLTEYADLADPQLQVTRTDGRLDVVGLFPTYTRANGSPPAYTGRAYQLTAAVTADGPATAGQAPASGVVRIGPDTAPTTGDRGVNRWLLPG